MTGGGDTAAGAADAPGGRQGDLPLGDAGALREHFRTCGTSVDLPARDSGALGRNWSEEALRRAMRNIGDDGLLALAVPRENSGHGASWQEIAAALEGFGEGCLDVGLGFVVCDQVVSMADCLTRFGSDSQKERWLTPLARGAVIGAQALTEPEAGSDVMAMTTTAEKTTSGYVLRGQKTLIGLASLADFAITFAVTDPEKGRWGLSAFVVTREDAGFAPSPGLGGLGFEASPLSHVAFEDCEIPGDRLLGSEGMGWLIIQHALQVERAIILASQVGAMARQFSEVVDYARTRQVGGVPIERHQSVSNRVADMAVRLETSRLILGDAARRLDAGENIARQSAMAKLHISESFAANSLDAMRVMGGRGFLAEFEAQQRLRDSIGGLIYAGTSDIQRQIIASLS